MFALVSIETGWDRTVVVPSHFVYKSYMSAI
jgi:hypothetical protein